MDAQTPPTPKHLFKFRIGEGDDTGQHGLDLLLSPNLGLFATEGNERLFTGVDKLPDIIASLPEEDRAAVFTAASRSSVRERILTEDGVLIENVESPAVDWRNFDKPNKRSTLLGMAVRLLHSDKRFSGEEFAETKRRLEEARDGLADKNVWGEWNQALLDDAFDGSWVLTMGRSAGGFSLLPCGPKQRGFAGNDGVLGAKKTHIMELSCGRLPHMVVAPLGQGDSSKKENRAAIKYALMAGMLAAYGDNETSPEEREMFRQGIRKFDATLLPFADSFPSGVEDAEAFRRIQDDPKSADRLWTFLEYAGGHTDAPASRVQGHNGKIHLHGLPPSFFRHFWGVTTGEGSGFAVYGGDNPETRDDIVNKLPALAARRLPDVDRLETARKRLEILSSVKEGSADFLAAATGGGLFGIRETKTSDGRNTLDDASVAKIQQALGPDFETGDEAAQNDLVSVWSALADLRDSLCHGEVGNLSSLTDFCHYLTNLHNREAGEGDRIDENDLKRVRAALRELKECDGGPADKLDKRDALCESVSACIFPLIRRRMDASGDGDGSRRMAILQALISNADKTEHTYAMWKFGTFDIKFGKARDVFDRMAELRKENGLIVPVCSWSEKNIPVGDWSVALVEKALSDKTTYARLTGTAGEGAKQGAGFGALAAALGHNPGDCPDSFAEFVVAGLANRLNAAMRSAPDGRAFPELPPDSTLSDLVERDDEGHAMMRKLLSGSFGGCRKLPKNFGKLAAPIADMVRTFDALRNRKINEPGVDADRQTFTLETLRDRINRVLLGTVMVCGGENPDDGPPPGRVETLSKLAETHGGRLGVEAEGEGRADREANRRNLFRYRRQSGSLVTERILHKAAGIFRVTGTEIFSGMVPSYRDFLDKTERLLPGVPRHDIVEPSKFQKEALELGKPRGGAIPMLINENRHTEEHRKAVGRGFTAGDLTAAAKSTPAGPDNVPSVSAFGRGGDGGGPTFRPGSLRKFQRYLLSGDGDKREAVEELSEASTGGTGTAFDVAAECLFSSPPNERVSGGIRGFIKRAREFFPKEIPADYILGAVLGRLGRAIERAEGRAAERVHAAGRSTSSRIASRIPSSPEIDEAKAIRNICKNPKRKVEARKLAREKIFALVEDSVDGNLSSSEKEILGLLVHWGSIPLGAATRGNTSWRGKMEYGIRDRERTNPYTTGVPPVGGGALIPSDSILAFAEKLAGAKGVGDEKLVTLAILLDTLPADHHVLPPAEEKRGLAGAGTRNVAGWNVQNRIK